MSFRGRYRRSFCIPFFILTLSLIGCGADQPAAEDPVAAESGEENEGSDTPATEEEEEPKAPRRESSTTVSTALVERRDLVLPVKAEGRIRARHTSEINFERAGRIDRIYVQEGQHVGRGQVLL